MFIAVLFVLLVMLFAIFDEISLNNQEILVSKKKFNKIIVVNNVVVKRKNKQRVLAFVIVCNYWA